MIDLKSWLGVSLLALFALPVLMPAQAPPAGTYYYAIPTSGPTTGIQNAIAACVAATTGPCTVIIPANYGGTGGVPGSNPNNAYAQPTTNPTVGSVGSLPSNVTVIDQRGGGATTLQNNENYAFSNVVTGSLLNCSHSNGIPTNLSNVFCFDVLQSANSGGSNYNYGKYGLGGNITNWSASLASLFSSTSGQAIGASAGSTHNGVGDTLGMSVSSHCHGGFVAYSDEGCEGMDLQVFQAGANGTPQDYIGTVSTGGTGVTTVTISNSQGEGSQGEGRYLLLTQGVSPSSSVLSAVTPTSGSVPVIYTLTGSSTLPASTTIATLNIPAAGIPAGMWTVTPLFSHGDMSGINTSTLLCIADPAGPLEFVRPSSVSVSGGTMNITVKRSHLASAIITSGGACGSFIDLTADNVTVSTFSNMINQVNGTMLNAWPILETLAPSGSGSSTTQQVYVAIQRQGAWGNLFSQWNSTHQPNNTFSIYPGAEVYSVADSNGAQSDTFQLSPNNVNWATSSTVDLPDHPSVNVSMGQWLTQQEFPGNFTGFGISYYGAVNGGTAMAGFTNMAPNYLYNGAGGTLDPPTGIAIGGDVYYDFYAGTGGSHADIELGCSAGCVNPYQYVLNVGEAGGKSDALLIDETSGQWQLTAGGSTAGSSPISYYFRKDGLEMPLIGAPTSAMPGDAKLYFNSSYQLCLMDQSSVNHCSSMAGSTNATSIQGTAVSMAAPTTNQVLAYNGSQYVPTTVSSGSGNVTGPTSSVPGDIATFVSNTGTSLQDSGVNINGAFLSGAWISLPDTGPSGIGTGAAGTTLWLGLSHNSSEYFVDSIAGDIAMRNKQSSSIRLGIDNGMGSAVSTMDISSNAVTLTSGIKLTGTHGGTNQTTGVVALSGGMATVSSGVIAALASAGSAGDAIELTYQNCVSCGTLYVGSVNVGMNFVIQSSNLSDSSNVFWNIRHIN